MFRQIFTALSSESTIQRAFDDLTEMLERAAWMFERANDVIHARVKAREVHEAIYEHDRAVNELERSIRRKVMRHLTVNPGHDVGICLALMSVSKDAERIGDYCKNVFEVGRLYSEGFHFPEYHEPLQHISRQNTEMFELVTEACRHSDEARAQRAIASAADIRRQCDRIIENLFQDEARIEFHEAVAISLLARHYKRVAGHLSNIATAVLGRLEDLDFYPEPKS